VGRTFNLGVSFETLPLQGYNSSQTKAHLFNGSGRQSSKRLMGKRVGHKIRQLTSSRTLFQSFDTGPKKARKDPHPGRIASTAVARVRF
jgi:hypothetical protein